jgi:hypothetical protein
MKIATIQRDFVAQVLATLPQRYSPFGVFGRHQHGVLDRGAPDMDRLFGKIGLCNLSPAGLRQDSAPWYQNCREWGSDLFGSLGSD